MKTKSVPTHKSIQTAIRNPINRKKPFQAAGIHHWGQTHAFKLSQRFLLWFADLLVCHSSVGVNSTSENGKMGYKNQRVTEAGILWQSKHRCLQTVVKLNCRPKTLEGRGEGNNKKKKNSDSLMGFTSSKCLKDLVWVGRTWSDRTTSSCYMVLRGRCDRACA